MKGTFLLKTLFTNRIWTVNTARASKHYARTVKAVKLARLTVGTFARNQLGFQCVALSYFVAMAVIPFCALLFAVTGGLGLSNRLSFILYNLFPENAGYVDTVMDKANNIIDVAKSGGVGILSALFFLWAILWMMFQMERVFNNVWGIQKIPRKIYKRFGFYLLVLVMAPFIALLFGSGIAYQANLTKLVGWDTEQFRVIAQVLSRVVIYGLVTLSLSLMYTFIPAAKVRYKFALESAILTSLVFCIFQYLYLETQVFVTRLNAVYGVIAAFPLFLIWLNFSWQIIIYGAALTYSFHHVDTYLPESIQPS